MTQGWVKQTSTQDSAIQQQLLKVFTPVPNKLTHKTRQPHTTCGCYLFTVSYSGLLFRRKCMDERNLSSRDRELWPVTLTFQLIVDKVKVNQHSKYLGHMSFLSKAIVRTHTHGTNCSTWTIKWSATTTTTTRSTGTVHIPSPRHVLNLGWSGSPPKFSYFVHWPISLFLLPFWWITMNILPTFLKNFAQIRSNVLEQSC